MEIYEAKTPDADKKWVLACDQEELDILRKAVEKVLGLPPHNNHDCDEDEHACAVLYMSHDLMEVE